MSGGASSERERRAERARRGLSRHEQERGGLPALARYEVLEQIGEGAVAAVFRARDRELGRTVALKRLKERAGLSGTARARFRRESQVMAGLNHPHIVAVYDAGEAEGELWFVMELVEGRTLVEALRDPSFGREDRLRLLEKAARAVGAAHERGVVHRDLKPGNILVTRSGEPKVADFGLAQLADSDLALTRTGAVLGTPLYMAPEQVRGGGAEISARTDVYALGAVLYEILAGRPPHVGETLPEVYAKIAQQDPAPPPACGGLEVVALKALDRDPARRYATAEAFADELRRHLAGEPVLARPLSPAARIWRGAVRRRAVLIPLATLSLLLAVAAVGVLRSLDKADRASRASELLEAARAPIEAALRAADDAEFARLAAEARGRIDRAAALAPDLPLSRHRLGELEELSGSFGKAEAAWRSAGSFGPSKFRLGRLLLQRAYIASLYLWPDHREEKLAEAERLAREGAAAIEAAGFESELQKQVAAAMLAHLRGDGKGALALCREGIARFGRAEGVEELHWLAGLRESKVEDQVKALDEALRLRPRFPLARFARGHARAVLGDHAGAIADYGEVVRALPEFHQARLSRADSCFAKGDGPAAKADYDELIRRGLLLPAAYNGRGRTRQTHLQDLDGALADLTEAIRLKPEVNVLPYLARAQVRLAKGDVDGSIADATRALEFNRWADIYLIRGKARLAKGDREGAIEDLEQVRKGSAPHEPARREAETLLAGARAR